MSRKEAWALDDALSEWRLVLRARLNLSNASYNAMAKRHLQVLCQ